MKEKIEIALCLDDNYAVPSCVLISSIKKTNQDIEIHYNIITEKLSEYNKTILTQAADGKTAFRYIDKRILSLCPVRSGDHITIATYYRILFPTLFPDSVSKILYIDGDVACTGSIKELWNTELKDYAAACVPDVYSNDIRNYNRLHLDYHKNEYFYFNAGIMLINLDYWRKNDIQTKTLSFISEYPERCKCHDQDALNYILAGKILPLHPKYNLQLYFFNNTAELAMDRRYFESIKEAVSDPVLVHYTSREKPWNYECFYPYKKIWYYYERQSGFICKKTHKYHGRMLLKYEMRKIFTFMHFLEKTNKYDFYNTKELQNIIISKISGINK